MDTLIQAAWILTQRAIKAQSTEVCAAALRELVIPALAEDVDLPSSTRYNAACESQSLGKLRGC